MSTGLDSPILCAAMSITPCSTSFHHGLMVQISIISSVIFSLSYISSMILTCSPIICTAMTAYADFVICEYPGSTHKCTGSSIMYSASWETCCVESNILCTSPEGGAGLPATRSLNQSSECNRSNESISGSSLPSGYTTLLVHEGNEKDIASSSAL